jgi:hypothetical protein
MAASRSDVDKTFDTHAVEGTVDVRAIFKIHKELGIKAVTVDMVRESFKQVDGESVGRINKQQCGALIKRLQDKVRLTEDVAAGII